MSPKFSKRWYEKKVEQKHAKRNNIKKMLEAMLKETEYENVEDGLHEELW